MVEINTTPLIFSIPSEYFNQLNNFYLENYGYDIYTQLLNYVYSELQQCENYSTEEPQPHPKPRIRRKRKKFAMEVMYPDNTTSSIENQTWKKSIELMNEWSKYKYDKSAREKVQLKIFSDKEIEHRIIPNIRRGHSKYAVVKIIGKKDKFFGHYNTLEDAITVRNFLEKQNWNLKYHSSNVMEEKEDITQYNYSDYLLNLALEGNEDVEK